MHNGGTDENGLVYDEMWMMKQLKRVVLRSIVLTSSKIHNFEEALHYAKTMPSSLRFGHQMPVTNGIALAKELKNL